MVLIRRPDGSWHEPESTKYENERALQDLVMLSPTLLPGNEELAVVDELSIPGVGFVDLVGVGSDGKIVIVECKLRANPEIRREVVGQVLSYAGGLWRMDYSQFETAFSARANSSLYDAVRQATATELGEEDFRAAVSSNLAAGAFRLVVAVDEITPELKAIIEFLNEHTVQSVEILALELRYSRDGDVELLNPNIYGAEAAEKKAKGSSGARWNEASFTEALQQRTSPGERAFLERLIEHGRTHGHHLFYGSGATPGMSCFYAINEVPTSVWAMYLHDGGPKVALSLGSVASKVSDDEAWSWVTELKQDPSLHGLLASMTPADVTKYPQLAVSAMLGAATQALFLKSLDRFSDQTETT